MKLYLNIYDIKFVLTFSHMQEAISIQLCMDIP